MAAAVRNERIPIWDNLRFFLIFLVVLGHLADNHTETTEWARYIYFFIYTFHMPAFIFVSGLFSKKAVDNRNYTGIFSYFVIYIVIKVIISISNSFESGTVEFNLLIENTVPWYALALFAFCLMTIFLSRFKPAFVLIFSILIACFAGFDDKVGDTLALMRIVTFYPFFFAGYCLKPEAITEAVKKPHIKVIAVIIFAALAAGVYFGGYKLYVLRPLLTGRNPYSKLKIFIDKGALFRAGYYPAAFTLICCLISLIPSKKIPLITRLGSRTIQVYALHMLIIRVIYSLFDIGSIAKNLFPQAPYVLIFIFAAAITLLCSLKIFEKPFYYILHPPLKQQKESAEIAPEKTM